MHASTSFATVLTGCTYCRYGPSVTLRFDHPAWVKGTRVTGLCGGDDCQAAVKQLYLAIVGAAGEGYGAAVRGHHVIAFLDERKALVGLRFLATHADVDFRVFLPPG